MILQRLTETNLVHSAGYGTDEFSESARAKIRKACNAPDADIHFLVGGTKCGALFGEAVVLPKHDFIPHFFTLIKQNGALLAKGRFLGKAAGRTHGPPHLHQLGYRYERR